MEEDVDTRRRPLRMITSTCINKDKMMNTRNISSYPNGTTNNDQVYIIPIEVMITLIELTICIYIVLHVYV